MSYIIKLFKLQSCRSNTAADVNDTNIANGANTGEPHFVVECRSNVGAI